MFDKIKRAYTGVDQKLRHCFERLARRMKSVRLTRAQWGRTGYYAALVLLLVILGTASRAYRARRAAEAPREPASRAALAAGVEAALPTPVPTAEPVLWVWPVEGEIIGAYSPELPVWSATLAQWQTHPALDIAGLPGEAVYACRDGVVSDAWHDRLWGNVIVIDHADGYQSTYAGLNTLNLAEVGQAVAAGDVISAVGQSLPCEAEQPPHIHFQLTKDGEPADFEMLVK